jgi:hypothetical protein
MQELSNKLVGNEKRNRIESSTADIKRSTCYATPRNICDRWEQNIMRDDVCCTTIIGQRQGEKEVSHSRRSTTDLGGYVKSFLVSVAMHDNMK